MGNEFWNEYNRLKNKKKKNETEDIAPVRTSKVETSVDTDTESSFWSEYEKEKARVEEWRNKDISKRSDDGKSIVPVNYKRDSDKEENPAGSKVTKETDKKESEKDKRTWFQKGAFSDGYQFGDAFKSFMATGSDLALGIVEGLGTMGEGVLDAGVHLVGYVADELGADSFAQKAHELANKNEVQELFQSVRYNAGADENGVFKDSLLGAKSRGVNNALGQIGGVIITGGAAAGAGMSAAGASAVTMGTMGASSFGSGVSEAYNSGAEDDPTSDAEAFTYGAISAASDVVSEMIFGGLGKQVKILGVSHGLSNADDVLAKTLSNKISSTLGKNLVEWGVKAGAEGLEEVIAGFGQAVGKKVTYMSEEELWDIVQDENLLEQFVVGALASGVAQAPSVHTANKAGVDYVSGLTANEEAVVNRVVEDTIAEAEKNGTKLSNKEKNDIREKVQTDMERGRISTDTIEEVLGGESYKAYTDAVAKEDALRKEYADLGKLQNPTLEQSTRYKELHDQRDTFTKDETRNALRGKVRDNVLGLVQGTRLAESYAEQARRGEYFADDLTTYKNEYARKSVENLVNSKAANNTNRTRELAETVAKIAQDKNITFDFTTDEKIKADGKAYISKKNITADGNAAVFDLGAKNLDADFTPVVTVNGKAVDGFKVDYENGTITFASAPEAGEIHVEYRRSGSVNGYYDKQNRVVTVNLNSPKAWQFIVGHEVTHSLEGTDTYTELSRAIADYAKTKGDYDGRWDALSSAYNSGTDIDTEITSDLVGEYLFTDEAFVQHLSTNHRNVFQRIYDEIKHLYKMVTAGSKEARELEKVKHAFEKAYRAQAETSTDNSGVYDEETDAQYSLVTDKETVDFLENQEHVKVYRAMQVIDGELYPPMAAVIPDGSKQLVEPTKQGEWYRADERPDLMIFSVKQEGKKARLLNKAEMKQNADVLYGNPQADDIITLKDGSTVTFGELTPKYNLDKGNKSTVPAAYNPYFHTSLAALNDQFSTAFKRPNLVVVEGYIPKSELTSGYQALYAKDSVGETEWHSGPVASALKGEKARKVFLSRWFKVGRIVSDAEAASMIAETLEGEGLSVPWNVVTPSLREALAAKGVDIDYKDVKLGSTTVTFDSTQDSVQYSLSDPNDDYSRIYDMRVEVNRLTQSIREFESTRDFKNAMNKLSEAINNDDIDNGVKAYQQWRIDSGYDALVNKRDALRVELENAEKSFNENIANKAAQEEKAAIEKSGLIESEYFRKQAVKEFGYTPYYYDAGYITPNGKMLNFSGEKGKHFGSRGQDHRAIGVIYADTSGTDALNRFMRDGNIRIMAESPGIDVSTVAEPTKEQYATIRRFINEYSDKGYFNVDLTDESGRVIGSLEYENRINPARVLNDIKHYFQTGEIREQSNIDKFRYSISLDSEGRELSDPVQNRFKNSKARDENGNLKVLYHGTASGEFTIFDKSKGSVEGDFGSGFYFTDNEADVSEHYEGGGPDFDNKVARRAEMIESEEGIDYDEAEKMARAELFKGSHKFEVYLNMENPAVVGETMLFEQDTYLEQYNEEDFDDYDEYIAECEQLLADDIENIVWEVERNTGAYSVDGLSDVLYEAYYEGGIGIEELKAKINDLYLEDENGNLIGNEVARQVIESLGYDGIIDPTVSGKWNMDIEEGTTHYIVFKPNQIKAVTNQSPTDNPDIHRSLSSDTAPVMGGNWRTPARDLRYEGAEDVAPPAPAEVATDTNAGRKIVSEADFAPIPEAAAHAMQDELLADVRDEDTPPEMDAPYYGEDVEQEKPADPFEAKDIETVGKRSIKAYMYENPEVKPFFQKEANYLLGELRNAIKGERTILHGDFGGYGAESYYRVIGTKRNASPDIEYLLDTCKYSYAQIEKGIQAILEDNGAENNAVSKRIEFVLNDRLRDGYQDWETGMEIPPDEGYLNLLREKEITEYNEEAFKRLVETADDSVIPPAAEDIAPVGISEGSYSLSEESVGVEEKPGDAQRDDPVIPREDNTPKRVKPTTAAILTEEPKPKNNKRGIWSLVKEYVLDNGMVFEEISKENNNRELEARWNSIRNAPKMAQYFIENGKNGVKSVNAVRKEVESRGLTRQFYEYMYHMHNIDRMSLESKAQAEAKQLLRENPMIAELTKKDTVDDIIAKIDNKTLQMSSEEVLNSDLSKSNSDMRRNKKEVAKELFEKVERYDNLMRVVNKPVFGKDVTADVSYVKVQELLKKNPELKRYAEDIYKNNRYLRNLMVEEGVISYETAKLWEEMYPHYVPIRREGDTGLNVNVPLDTRRTGINAPVKGATGGSRNILPLFDTLGVRAIQTYNAIAKNRFGIELKDTLGSTVDTNTATLDDAISTLDQSDGLLKAGENGMNPTFTVFENGERVTFEITDEMYDAMKPTGDVLSYTNKVANTASNLFRGLLTEYNPVFLAKNAIKDAQDVLINSQHPLSTYKAIPRAVWQMADKGKYYREYVENGGEQNTYFDRETTTFTKEGGAKEIAKTLLGLNLVSKANNIVEMTPRLAEYIASREAGRSVDVAMLDAARVTTNFAAGGKLTKFLNRNGATFLSASVNGAVQQARNIVEAKRNGLKGMLGLAAKFLAAGLPAIILNSFVWDDDEEYEELSDYVKQNYYIVGKYGDGKFVRIPKGRTVAVIQNAFEQMEHIVTGDDEADLGAFLELAVSNLAPNNPLDNNIIAPIKQVVENKTWYGEDLIPQRLQNLPAAEQYDESTDEISRWLGEKLNYSPYKINYLLNQYTGGVGDVVLPMLTPEAESGDDSILGDLLAPVLSTFTTDSVMNNKNVSDFYDTKDELTTNANSAAATDEDVLMSKYMNSINAELSGLYAQKREVQNSNLSDAEKYSEVRAIQSQIVDLTRKSLNTYEDIKYDGEYAVIGDRYFKRDDNGEWQKLTDDQVKKHTITSAAGNAYYATDGSTHYRWYVKDGETAGEWRKITDDELAKQNKVTSALGIDAKEYWRKKDEYDFAYKSPGKYAVSKAVGGYDAYKTYSSELYDIKADKDADGKSISGSRKDKVIDYISGMDADYGEKIILFKMEYPADDTYNNDIIDYLNSREDFTYEQIETILKELGFKVSKDGYITWD